MVGGISMSKKQKLSIVGQIAAGLAHEIKNPLTAIKGYGQLLRKNYGHDDKINDYSDVILSEVDKITAILDSFLLLADPPPAVKQEAELKDIVSEVVAMVSPMAYLQSVVVDCKVDNQLPPCWLDYAQIKQVLLHMCENALDAMPNGGKLKIRAYLAGSTVCIEICDTGCGIAVEDLSKIGTPFFTTKDGGTGLNLSRAYAFVKSHNGTIDVDSAPGQGTRFRIYLPFPGINVACAAAALTAEGL